jgi:hypothetical protein
MRKTKTKEEKATDQITGIVSDLTLDLEQVGVYLGQMKPQTINRRLQIIAETAKEVADEYATRDNIRK